MSKKYFKLLLLNIILIIAAAIVFYFYPLLGFISLTFIIGFDINKLYIQSKTIQAEKIFEQQKFQLELSQTENTLKNQEAQLEALLNNIDSPIFYIDSEQHLTYYNIPFKKTFDVKKTIATDYLKILPSELIKYIDDALFLNLPTEHSIKLDEKYFLFTSHPVKNNQNYFLGNIFILNDISSLERSKQAQRHFIAYASHELKTPISAIRGAIEILINHQNLPTEDKDDFQNMILAQIEKMNILVSDLLELSKLESETYHLEYSLVNIYSLIIEIKKPFEQELLNKNINLFISKSNSKFYVDQFRMKQVFTNLLSNAVKFTKINGEIIIDISESQNDHIIKFIDNGIGINKKDIKKILEPFYTINSNNPTPGTGLGLSIVQSIIALHNGTIDIESKEQKGTIVTIKIPKKYSI